MRLLRELLSIASLMFSIPGVLLQQNSANGQSGPRVSEINETLPSRFTAMFETDCEEWHDKRDTLTADWHGSRTSLEEKGITFDATVTQFYQGINSGGFQQRFRYSGHGDYDLTIDFGKLLAIEGLRLEFGSEHRFGQTVNDDTGSIIPVALLPNLPGPELTDLALTKVLIAKEFSERFEIFFGKLDSFDFDSNAFASGKGRERFFNSAFNYNPLATRTVPFSTLGAGFNVMNEGERLFTLAVLNTEDTATTSGFDVLFTEGAVILSDLRLPVQICGRTGHQMFGGSWSSRKFDSLQQEGRVTIPDISIPEKSGSWALYWNFDQYLWEDPYNSDRGWGVFGRAGISDGNPNAKKWFLSFGLGGNSPLVNRCDDTFGIGWFYVGLSDELQPLLQFDDTQGVEMYYKVALSPWFHITADLQIINPNERTLDTAITPGLRGQLVF